MEQKLEDLKNSLTYQMSLGSRELYHSNVWAWLMDTDPRYISVFFEEYDNEKSSLVNHINRENNHFDLSFESKSSKNESDDPDFYVIENKIKSLPNIKQLENYNATIDNLNKNKNNKIHKVLVVLINRYSNGDRDYIEKQLDWNIIEYHDVSIRIKERLDSDYVDRFTGINKELIEEYSDQIETIYSVINDRLNDYDKKYTYKGAKDLGDTLIRLDDVYKKIKGWDVFNFIVGELEKDPEITELKKQLSNYALYEDQSFNRKKVTLDFRWQHIDELQKKNKWESERLIGIQIEELDYRFVYGEPSQKSDKKEKIAEADNIFSKISHNYKWFDKDYYKHPGELFEAEKYPTSLRIASDGRLYNKYLGDQIFIYQYYNLPEKKGDDLLDYENLFEKVKEDLIKAAEIIKAMDKS